MAAHQHLSSVSSVRGAAFAINNKAASRARECEHLSRAWSNLRVELDVAALNEVHSLQKPHTVLNPSRSHFLARFYPVFSYQIGRQRHNVNRRPYPEHHQKLESLQFASNLSRGSVRRFTRSMAQVGAEGNGPVHLLTVSPSVVGPASGKMADKLEAAGFLVHKLWEQADKDVFFAKDGLHCRALVPSHEGVDSQLMDWLPNLEIISNFGVGYDSIDVSAAKERGIRVTNTPDVLTEDVADLAIALLLDISRRVTEGDRYLREGKWEGGNFPVQRKASGKSVGILGLGRIGQAIATRAAAFNMKIAYHSRNEKSGVPYKYYSNLVDMAKASDFLIVACPGGSSTRHLVTKEVLDALGPEGCLINIARGSVVVESDLVKALAEGRLGSAGLDVFENEPQVPEELKKMDNVVLQPHVGSATHETREDMASLVVANLKAHFSGKELLTPVV